MSKARLIYDGACPICTNYVKSLKTKISGDLMTFLPTTSMLDDFQYVNSSNVVFHGKLAMKQLSIDFPIILDYMWMLPESYRLAGLKTAYVFSGIVRKTYHKVSKGCGCGKKR